MKKILVPYSITYKNKITIVYAHNPNDAINILNIPKNHQNSKYIQVSFNK
jgi:hypothetical protein